MRILFLLKSPEIELHCVPIRFFGSTESGMSARAVNVRESTREKLGDESPTCTRERYNRVGQPSRPTLFNLPSYLRCQIRCLTASNMYLRAESRRCEATEGAGQSCGHGEIEAEVVRHLRESSAVLFDIVLDLSSTRRPC